jgi:hypothetical protein
VLIKRTIRRDGDGVKGWRKPFLGVVVLTTLSVSGSIGIAKVHKVLCGGTCCTLDEGRGYNGRPIH